MRRCVVRVLAVIFTAAALPARADITRRDNYAAIVMDARGQVLAADNADEARFPASLTKMMTLYMLFEAMRDGRVSPQGTITMTAEAASRPPSKLGIPAGMSLSVEHAILAVITRSANDVAAAIGERLAVVITGALQTPTGRMVFARAEGPAVGGGAERSGGKGGGKPIGARGHGTPDPR